MLRARRFCGRLVGAVLFAAGLGIVLSSACAQPTDFDAAIQVMRDSLAARPDIKRPGRQLTYSATLVPTANLLTRLQALFEPYFGDAINLIVLLQRLVMESAVQELPSFGWVLYNPRHMLFLHLPSDWDRGGEIRVATLDDVREILSLEKTANPILTAYAQGFEHFALLGKLILDPSARDTLQVIWNTLPRSEGDKERMRYLLLRATEQTLALQDETSGCRDSINRFVEDVRTGKRLKIPTILGMTDILKPVRFIRHESNIYVVLGERLMARYYVLAHFTVTPAGCNLDWEKPVFTM